MIEFRLLNGTPCAINPRLVSAVWERPSGGGTYICFGIEDEYLPVVDDYEFVLAAIRSASSEVL